MIDSTINNTVVKKAYILERAWSDTMENDSSRAFGYSPYAVTLDRTEAERQLNGSPKITKEKYGWAAKEGAPSVRIYETDLI